MAKGHHSPLALQSAPPAWGPAGSMERESGVAGQASTDMLMWGKALWRAGMTLEKSKDHNCACREESMRKRNLFLQAPAQGRLLCPLARTLVLACGEGLTWRGQSVCDGDLLDPGPRVLQFH